MCSLCGDPGHDDMRCPCFGYSGDEYKPPEETNRTIGPRFRRDFRGTEFSLAMGALPASPPDPSRNPRR